MPNKNNFKVLMGLCLFLVVTGLFACSRGSNSDGPAAIRDQTGEQWDISQAKELGFKADGFQYGLGRNAFTPLDNDDLSTETSSMPASERVIGIANEQEAHAYSVRKLSRHEIANTFLGDVPIAVGY